MVETYNVFDTLDIKVPIEIQKFYINLYGDQLRVSSFDKSNICVKSPSGFLFGLIDIFDGKLSYRINDRFHFEDMALKLIKVSILW